VIDDEVARKTRTTPKEDDEYLLSSQNSESAPLSTLKSVCKEYNLVNNLTQADHVYSRDMHKYSNWQQDSKSSEYHTPK